jgi:hypothetical protein
MYALVAAANCASTQGCHVRVSYILAGSWPSSAQQQQHYQQPPPAPAQQQQQQRQPPPWLAAQSNSSSSGGGNAVNPSSSTPAGSGISSRAGSNTLPQQQQQQQQGDADLLSVQLSSNVQLASGLLGVVGEVDEYSADYETWLRALLKSGGSGSAEAGALHCGSSSGGSIRLCN